MSYLKKYKLHFFLIFTGILIGSFWDQPHRYLLRSIYQNIYAKHMYRCDSSMRDHFIAKAQVNTEITKENVENLIETEVSLIDCHDYDMYRKKLISYGLNDHDLSLMGLKIIEKKGSDIQNLVRIHEIRY